MQEFLELPGYEILEKIGEGGTSTVWKARQISLDRIVAIKALAPSSVPDPEAMGRFRLEAQAAARLKHSSIVQIYDAGEHAGRPYLVMEYIEGCTVGDLLRKAGRMTERNALLVAEGVAQALAYAWDKDCIIHLDVKPDNVMLDADGAVKVTDLGLARFIGLKPRRADGDEIMGTPNYVSPEQAQGVDDLDCRTDIYSLGAMLYHLVTGRLPFAGRPGSSAMDAHVEDFLPDPIDLQPDLSPATAWLLEKLMAKDRAFRPAYWSLVLADLAEVKEGRMPRDPRPTAGQSTVLRSASRGEVKPPPPPPAAALPAPVAPAHPKRRISGVGRSVTQLLFLSLAAAGVLIYFLMGMSETERAPVPGQTAPAEWTPVLTPGVPVRVPAPTPAPAASAEPAVSSDDQAPLEFEWDEEPTQPATPAPRRTARAMTQGAVDWSNEDFKEGARLYNDAYALYIEFQQTRKNREDLPRIEKQAREAVQKFESIKEQAPPDVDMDGYIQQCYHLIADVRHSTLLDHEDSPRRRKRLE